MVNATNAAAPPRRRTPRRWLRYSLRSLLVAVTVGCVALALWANSAQRQRRAVEAIRAAGGTVVYDFEAAGNDTPWPAWLSDVLGVDYFACPVKVGFMGHVNNIDEIMIHVRVLRRLETLSLNRTQVTDRGLAQIAELSRLKRIVVYSFWVNDAGLAHLSKLTELQELYLSGSIGDAGMVHLNSLTNLRELSLYDTQVSGAGLAHVRGLTKLELLSLNNTHVDDASMENLRAMQSLQHLYLSNTRVSDAGLQKLHGLTSLQWIYAEGTQISEAGVAQLRNALPNCRVKR